MRCWEPEREQWNFNFGFCSVFSVEAPPPPWWSPGLLRWSLRTNQGRGGDNSGQWKTEKSLSGSERAVTKVKLMLHLCLPNHIILNFQTQSLTSSKAWICFSLLTFVMPVSKVSLWLITNELEKEGSLKERVCVSHLCPLSSLLTVMCRPRGSLSVWSRVTAGLWLANSPEPALWLADRGPLPVSPPGHQLSPVPWDQRPGQKLFVA